MMMFTPPTSRSKGKSKVGKSVWEDSATALGGAHNVVTNEELKGLSSILSHKLVNRHINKLVPTVSSSLNFSLCPRSLTLYSSFKFWRITTSDDRLFEHRGEGSGCQFKGRIRGR